MMQGDQYRIPITLSHADGTTVTADELKDLEVSIGALRKTLSSGAVSYDEAEKKFYVYVTQKETFLMQGIVTIQARLLFRSGDVVGVTLGSKTFDKSLSREVLE